MPSVSINFLAVLMTAIIGYLIGALWYSPLLFGKKWMKLEKIKPPKKQSSMMQSYIAQFIITLVATFVLAVFVDYASATSFSAGALIGFLSWIGFIATGFFQRVLWQNKKLQSYLIEIGHFLIQFVIVAGILAVWQ